MSAHEVRWRAAEPLWGDAAQRLRPTLLRFDHDAFMDELLEVVTGEPTALRQRVAVPETWRGPAAGLASDTAGLLRLYQPLHGRFYLAAATLVCARYGLPDRRVDAGADERVVAVLRRVEPGPGATVREWARVLDDAATTWVPAPPDALTAGEDVLPAFALPQQPVGGQPRRLLCAYLPVGTRESLAAAAVPPAAVPGGGAGGGGSLAPDPMLALADERLAWLAAHVTEPLQAAAQALARDAWPAGGDRMPRLREAVLLALVDLVAALDAHVGGWRSRALRVPTDVGTGDDVLARPFSATRTWRQALIEVASAAASRPTLDFTSSPAPLAGRSRAQLLEAVERLVDRDGAPGEQDLQRAVGAQLPAAAAAGAAASVSAAPPAPARAVPGGRRPRADAPPDTPAAAYHVRFCYLRPRCRPDHREVLSPPSRRFAIAGVFDPDAPARPVRITLPIDTSATRLRDYPKQVSIVLGQQLRRQMDEARRVLPFGEAPSPRSVDVGMLCQLSIPIITICALLLLMIMVQLLNVVFWWLPAFVLCRPRLQP